jgi:hypothetical protein
MKESKWVFVVTVTVFILVCVAALFFALKCLMLETVIAVMKSEAQVGYVVHITVDGQDTMMWFKTHKIVVDNMFALENGDGSLYQHLSKDVILDIKPIKE